ncbi:MAG TPA: tetratricopeptide repeat protein [Pyrinomonadaceae bacterium]|nr:tetratricopeptide repeat protein [Pyrinomonadaceae bacterium]
MKNKILLLILTLVFLTACYNSGETGDSKTTKRIEKTSPVADKSTTPETSPTPAATGNFSQAKSDYDAKNYEKAAAGFQEIVKADANNLEAHLYLGKSFQALKKDDEAISAFKEVLKIKREHADANFELGNIYNSRKDYETASPFYQVAAKTDFKNPKVLMALGDNYTALKKDDYAIVQYIKVNDFDKTNSEAMYKTGLAYISLNNKIAARQALQRLESVDAEKAKKLSELIDKMK